MGTTRIEAGDDLADLRRERRGIAGRGGDEGNRIALRNGPGRKICGAGGSMSCAASRGHDPDISTFS